MTVSEVPTEAIAAAFAVARKMRDPMFREYVREFTAPVGGMSADLHWLIALPGEPMASVMRRLDDAGGKPVVLAMADESQPFGYRMLIVSGPDAATLAGWRSTLAIHDDPELHATLTAAIED